MTINLPEERFDFLNAHFDITQWDVVKYIKMFNRFDSGFRFMFTYELENDQFYISAALVFSDDNEVSIVRPIPNNTMVFDTDAEYSRRFNEEIGITVDRLELDYVAEKKIENLCASLLLSHVFNDYRTDLSIKRHRAGANKEHFIEVELVLTPLHTDYTDEFFSFRLRFFETDEDGSFFDFSPKRKGSDL